jgi:hypothetical protein
VLLVELTAFLLANNAIYPKGTSILEYGLAVKLALRRSAGRKFFQF